MPLYPYYKYNGNHFTINRLSISNYNPSKQMYSMEWNYACNVDTSPKYGSISRLVCACLVLDTPKIFL